MIHKILAYLLISIVFNQINAQQDNRYDPFDWVLYTQLGTVTSVTEGFSYLYVGTKFGGVVRIYRYGHYLDETLTTAQGLKENNISAVHFDQQTGYLWVATQNFIHSSHTREGNWYINRIDEWGLPSKSQIVRMGSSKDYIWIQLGSSFVKLDHISGIFLGSFPSPDDDIIEWSESIKYPDYSTEVMNEYSLTDGWIMVGDSFINPWGNYGQTTIFYIGQEGDVILGTEDGTIFIGDNQMKLLEPVYAGLGNRDVQFITGENGFYLGGRLSNLTQGLTYFDPRRKLIEIDEFVNRINLTTGSYYCSLQLEDELWYGGNNMIAVYNKKEDFWRTFDETRGFYGKVITDMVADSENVWVASSSGLFHMNQKDKRVQRIGFEKIFNHQYIYDIELKDDLLWIASDYYLTIVDLSNEKVLSHKNVGKLGEMDGVEDILSGFKVIEVYNNEVMVSTRQGVWSFNLSSKKWIELVDASVFAGKEIRAMARFEKYIFLATNDGFIRYDIKDRFIRDYHYNFLGIIHDFKVDKNNLWLGTSNGLIKFKWTKD
jgi:ligand-binding sensor domain-containing protein